MIWNNENCHILLWEWKIAQILKHLVVSQYRNTKRQEDTFMDDEYVIALMVMALHVHIYAKTYQIVHLIYVQSIVYQLYLTKAINCRNKHLRQWLGHRGKKCIK